jgi:hypothetical protein
MDAPFEGERSARHEQRVFDHPNAYHGGPQRRSAAYAIAFDSGHSPNRDWRRNVFRISLGISAILLDGLSAFGDPLERIAHASATGSAGSLVDRDEAPFPWLRRENHSINALTRGGSRHSRPEGKTPRHRFSSHALNPTATRAVFVAE